MLVFGLTGGVACGKSTVAARFRGGGVEVLDADRIARQVVEPGSDGLRAVVAAFGEDVLQPDGTLDRAALGRVVFADATQRARLNALLHPRIGAETAAQLDALRARGVKLACYEAALLVENGMADAFRPLVVVTLPAEAQLRRLMARDALDRDEAAQRLASQAPADVKIAAADHVIDNRGDRAALERRADEVLAAIRERAGVASPEAGS